MTDCSQFIPYADTLILAGVSAAVGWLAKKATELIPALGSVLTASRVQQAEEAVSNVLVSKVNDVLAGKTTFQAEANQAMTTLSTQAKTAMSAQGTTEDMLAARAIGNALVKIGTPAPAVAPMPAVKS
jgi:hypothetical protein